MPPLLKGPLAQLGYLGSYNNIYFGIYDFVCPVADIADILRIDGYRGISKGDLEPYRKDIVCETGSWEIKSPLGEEKDIEDHIQWVLDLMVPKLDQLKLIYKQYGATAGLAISTFNYNVVNPGIHLERELVEKINMLEASIDIDIYNL